jgi:hypothetical protein
LIAGKLTVDSFIGSKVSFSQPFHTEGGIGVLVKKPVKQKDPFLFVNVFDWQLWLCMLFALVVTAICIFLLDRSRYLMYSKQELKEKENLTYQYNLVDSFWLT